MVGAVPVGASALFAIFENVDFGKLIWYNIKREVTKMKLIERKQYLIYTRIYAR